MQRAFSAAPCPCRARENTPLAYADCCQRWHDGLAQDSPAPDVEALMRSRYSAYALAQPGNPRGHAMLRYLLATWHVSTRPDDMELSPTQWVGLDIADVQSAGAAGIVEFTAHFKDNGKALALHERSRFVQLAGQWLYIDGEIDPSPA